MINLYEQHAGRLAGAVVLVLAIVLGMLVARLGWALVPPPDGIWQPAPVQPRAESSGGPAYDMQRLVSAELMGSYEAPEQSASEQAVEDAPETRLSLTLLGVYAADEDSMSRAIIASSQGDEDIYAIGDTISRNVTLHSVFADRVIISREGTLETLRMERDGVGDARTAGSGASRTPVSNSGNLQAPNPERLGDIRNELLSDPSKASNYIRVVPASSGGAQRGYRIYPGRERALFEAAGLRPGDLVTAVNGIPLDSAQRALSLLNELSNAQSINVTVERGGSVQNYTLSTN